MGNISGRLKASNKSNPLVLDLPFDIMIDIFLRLPVKCLLSSKCVCRTFYNLIQSPEFIDMHLKQNKSQRPIKLCAQIEAPWPEGFEPLKLNPNVGSSNGLVCYKSSGFDIVIWNPATRQHRVLTNSDYGIKTEELSNVSRNDCFFPGFDYIPSIKDYKLAVIVLYKDSSILVGLFTLGTNSSKRIFIPYTGLSRHPEEHDFPVTMNGFVHFVTNDTKTTDDFLVSFNLEDEKFTTTRMPSPRNLCGQIERILIPTLDENLTMFVVPIDDAGGSIEISVLGKDNNNGRPLFGSWTEQATIEPSEGLSGTIPRAFWLNGEIVFCHPNTYHNRLYDLVTKELKDLHSSVKRPMLFDTYIESLIPINGAEEKQEKLPKRSWFRSCLLHT